MRNVCSQIGVSILFALNTSATVSVAEEEQQNKPSVQESKEYVAMGRAAWRAFECQQLAMVRDDSEYGRLFRFGYEQAEKFLTAIQDGKVYNKHVVELPLIVMVILKTETPTVDFALGRIYQAAVDLTEVDYDSTLEGARKRAYMLEFSRRNCELIGK